MPYAANDGIRIHYHLEGNPDGPPLVLQHYLFGTLHDWYEHGYGAVLGDHYRLILIDARGHGLSDKPHDPDAYRAARHAGDVVAVLDQLDISRTHYCGYSLVRRSSSVVHIATRVRTSPRTGSGAGFGSVSAPQLRNDALVLQRDLIQEVSWSRRSRRSRRWR